jgi:hypothetical protein
VRPLAQTALVYKDDGAPLALGFLLSRGHSLFFQAAMASSLRSRARPVGRWGLNPNRKIRF